MYSLTICFGPAATTWMFLFKEKETAQGAWESFQANANAGNGTGITDDFGQQARIQLPIHGTLLEDLDQVKQARIERSLVDAQAQALFNQRASTDPVVRQAMSQRGAPILQPMPGGFRN
jgi:transcription initiation factor TFIID subunit TAF12